MVFRETDKALVKTGQTDKSLHSPRGEVCTHGLTPIAHQVECGLPMMGMRVRSAPLGD